MAGNISTGRAAARLFLACAVALTVTVLLVPMHWLALRTGLLDRERATRLWSRAILAALGWRVHVHGRIAQERPLLLAANHVSWSDILVLTAHATPAFIAKSEVAGWPLFGFLAKLQNTVFVERERRSGAADQAADIAGRLEGGTALVLFPEGTTADGNSLLPFKSSLFGAVELAARGEDGLPDQKRTVTVQPAAVAYTRLYGLPLGHAERALAAWVGEATLAGHLWLLARHGPLDVVLAFGNPISGGAGRKALASEAEGQVRTMMAAALRGADAVSTVSSGRKPLEAS